MDYHTAVKTCFVKYVDFSGRAVRSEYWWFALFCFLGSFLTTLIDHWYLSTSTGDTGPSNLIFGIVVLIPSISVTARRLHDVNKSGWWQLIYITIIGILFIIIWCATPGNSKKNMFGNPIKLKRKR